MDYRRTNQNIQTEWDKCAEHPLQTWQWGEFRHATGVKVVRLGGFENNVLTKTCQLTFHKIPFTPYTIGYYPKGPLPDKEMLSELKQLGRQENALYIQIEPNIPHVEYDPLTALPLKHFKENAQTIKQLRHTVSDFIPAARPLFTKYTFTIDLTPSEDELLRSFSSKTRYNIRLAQKKGVVVNEDNSDIAFNAYLNLLDETTKRQGFFAHERIYHQKMWHHLRQNDTAHLLTATYEEKIVVAWILFLHNNTLYYPYGASTQKHKEVMASNLMLWEAIRFGKKHSAKDFDLWGTPGLNPKPSDPYYGFHRFKIGYHPTLIEFAGSFDLVLQPLLYRLFTLINGIRWIILKMVSTR